MATKSAPPPLVKAEHEPTLPPPSGTTPVKYEPHEVTNTNTNNPPPPTHTPENDQQLQPQQPPPPPHFINSVNEIRNLSTALSAFQRLYDELQDHLDFIRTAIDSELPKPSDTVTSPPPPLPLAIIPSPEAPGSNTAKPPVTESANSEPQPNNTKKAANSEQKPNNTQKASRSELENLCEMMCSRGLRKYLMSQLSNVHMLREETPKALKFAPNPAKLVFECFGRFFLQGSKAYTKDSPMIPAREASVLVLEYFLLMGCDGVDIEPAVKEEAEKAAVAWRKRLVSEGGLAKACEIDARGLLLFVGGFGIPGVFKDEDLRHLIRLSNAGEISGALRRSSVLLARIPEIIEWMMKNKMETEAVDIAYTFGAEDRFPTQTILTSFLRESKETLERRRKAAQGSFTALNEANKKHLADLKSVIKCLKDHKIDPSKLLPGWQIDEKILSLEKDIAELDKKIGEKTMPKRKADETESYKKLKTQEVKRSRLAVHGQQRQKATGRVDNKSSYNGLTHPELLDGRLPGQISCYSGSSSILHGFGAGLLPENIAGSVPGSGGGVLVGGVGAGISAGIGGVLPTGSYPGAHGRMVIDTAGQMMNHNIQPYGWRADAALDEQLVGRPRPSAVGVNGSYRPSPALGGFVGLPNAPSVGGSSRSSATNLYHFADAVLESELHHSGGSQAGGTVPPVVPAQRSSYLY